MTKTKIILGLTMMLSILAITTTPAAAKFRAVTNRNVRGSSQLEVGSVVSLGVDATAGAITSSKAPDTWTIQDSKAEQNVTKEGDHLDQEITFQEIRTASGALVTVNNPIIVQYIQTGLTTSDVAVSKPVVVRVFLSEKAICTVKIPAFGPNKQLTKVNDTNIETTKALELKTEVGGISSTSEPEEFCKLAGIEPAPTTGTLAAIAIEHGVIQV